MLELMAAEDSLMALFAEPELVDATEELVTEPETAAAPNGVADGAATRPPAGVDEGCMTLALIAPLEYWARVSSELGFTAKTIPGTISLAATDFCSVDYVPSLQWSLTEQ